MFEDYSRLTSTQIRQSIRLIKEYGEGSHIWGLTITFKLLESSCEPELRERVLERMMAVPSMEQGGPLYFKLAIESITSMSYTIACPHDSPCNLEYQGL